MRIELTKETEISKGGSSIIPAGEESIWYWVRAYKEDNRTISECFREKDKAELFYRGLKAFKDKYGSCESQSEIIMSDEIPD